MNSAQESEYIAERQPTIQSLLEQGRKEEAWKIVEEISKEVEFPNIAEVKKDFESDSKQWKWGQWGPKDDLVGNAVMSVEESFLQNAGMLMSTKGLQHGRNEAAKELEVQGALYTAYEDDGQCPLCASLDGLECRVPSEEFDRYSPPQHCFCNCMWVYVNKEEEGWKPDDDWEGEITKRSGGVPPDDLIDKHGHANSTWEKSPKKGDNEAGVTFRTMEREAKKAFSTKREKPPETQEIVTESSKSAIIEERAVNVWIDELTPCLFDNKTGETVKTNYKPISSLSEIKKVQKEQAWVFDWVKEWGRRENGSEIYKLTLDNDAQAQGIIHLIAKMGFVEAKTVESAPHNRVEVVGAENQKYKGVGAHLFAIAVKRSIEEGNGGYVGFTSVTSRVEQYKKMLNAGIVGRAPEGGTRMEINEKYARMLYNKYFGETP